MLETAAQKIVDGLIIGAAWIIWQAIGICDWIRER